MFKKLDLIVKAALPGALLVPLLGLAYYYLIHPSRNVGYAPEQPIPFSHKLHAGATADGGLGIACKYCHYDVSKSNYANIPALSVCMGCHAQVTSVAEKPDIKYLKEHFEMKKPIEWTKIHDLPDHVRFNHEPHIRKGLACQTCHGEIQTMDRVEQAAPLTMGWCVNCHRKPENNAPTECGTCHY